MTDRYPPTHLLNQAFPYVPAVKTNIGRKWVAIFKANKQRRKNGHTSRKICSVVHG